MIRIAAFLAFGLMGFSAIATANYLTAEQVIEIFDYPDIKASDKTGEVAAKYGDPILSATLFEPNDNGFSRIQLLVTKGGFLLKDSLRQKLEASPENIRRVTLSNGATGFIGLEGAGPGGEGYIAIAHLDNPNVDLQIKLIISNDGASQSGPNIERFRSKLRDAETLKMALEKMLDGAAIGVVSQGVQPTAPAVSINEPAPDIEPQPAPAAPVVKQEEKRAPEPPAIVKEKPALSARRPWWLAGLALAIAFILWKIIRRKQA